MPGHSRPKDGVLRTPMCRASTSFIQGSKAWMAGTSPAMTSELCYAHAMALVKASTSWNWRRWRSNLRLTSSLVLLSFVICHLSAHSVLLISLDRGQDALKILMSPWQTWIGIALLTSALLVHYTNALWSIYLRRSLRLSRWEWTQLALGLCIPALLMAHVVSTRIAESFLSTNVFYSTALVVQWLMFPWLGVVQVAAVLTG